jgi:two-component system alkaline phosphatase synthesis response regulator PhoP
MTAYKRILIVDDDAFIRRPLEFLLKNAGFETDIAGDGEACLAAMERCLPDLVCLDIMMPVRDGFSTLEEIRRRGHLKRTPVILLSAKGQDGDIARARALGAVAFVPKPYSPKELLAQIRTVLDVEATHGGDRS